MSDKLSPKPVIQNPLLGWEDLNRILQSVFSEPPRGTPPGAVIPYPQFSMSKDEIMLEARKQGYKVTDVGDGTLLIE